MSRTTAPVSEGGFAFAHGIFLAEASNQNQHRRATQDELRAHFASGSDKDFTAHWFEAQLIHYGLRPSKVKSVARMRLFDALRGGTLSVPRHIADLEARLKKEWIKRDRQDKKAAKILESAEAPQAESSQKSATRKRKADVTVNVTVNANLSGITASTAPTTANAAKKPKIAAPSENSSSVPARRGPTSHTARRGGISSSSTRQEAAAARSSPAPVFRTKQTARRSRPFAPRGRIPSSQLQSGGYRDQADVFDEPPPPYRENSEEDVHHDGTANLAPLGLLNGRYDISCPFVESEWPLYGSDLSLVLTLAGSSLWARFDLGIIDGVMHFEERPRRSSFDRVPFHWRGREAEGPIFYDDENNEGWIRFLGDGRIEGWVEYQGIRFEGQRIPGQGTKSEIDARTLQNEWNEYTEDEYERLNQARW
ncbi:hypothetical protein Trco_007371 [Trichoderma cornu-damae]|uniref:Uncharacterized protein n=1 Tax=Trichoderma cornu-damae TaxID=654480 RepID=A0A9P8QFP3_9HYPO|nr:hypothetical protein Trco_007371 [Trichoderma cornu-damae]